MKWPRYKASFILKVYRLTVLIFLMAPNIYAENLSRYLLNYPNLDDPDGEVVLNNQYVVLQKLIVGPGEWEGVHSHPGNQIYVHMKIQIHCKI